MSRRIDIKALLADPVRHRQLCIDVIIATQAREGSTTTPEQAARAYDTIQLERERGHVWKPNSIKR